MTHRAISQKIGARGHKWLAAHVEDNPDWLTRELSEDYGVDMEFELTEGGLKGEIIKVQIKASTQVKRKNGKVRLVIERKYLKYAATCRYPVLLVLVDLHVKNAWYIWLQDWLIIQSTFESPLLTDQSSWAEWVPESQTVRQGLQFELKAVARWEGETQLFLSLMDALRSAVATRNRTVVEELTKVISASALVLGDAPLNQLIDKAVALGNRMRGSVEGNAIAEQLFALVRKFGGRVSLTTVHNLVIRGESYSRTGLAALGILYDKFHEHIRSLSLPEHFILIEPRVAYYCAYREFVPSEHSGGFASNPGDFRFAGLKYVKPDRHWDKYANRGPSALLDYLIPENDG